MERFPPELICSAIIPNVSQIMLDNSKEVRDKAYDIILKATELVKAKADIMEDKPFEPVVQKQPQQPQQQSNPMPNPMPIPRPNPQPNPQPSSMPNPVSNLISNPVAKSNPNPIQPPPQSQTTSSSSSGYGFSWGGLLSNTLSKVVTSVTGIEVYIYIYIIL